MRLWSIHPKYLDAKGIVALWREALLAQKVLQGKTKGYTNHPQLIRFRNSADPPGMIGAYLEEVYKESLARGYNFNFTKIYKTGYRLRINVNRGQLMYEFSHLKNKLKIRDGVAFNRIKSVDYIEANPAFNVVEGDVESWERI
ncbi:MAG: hypothetical protein JW864_02485 [Spirochaetes bacterium]|nr:hypothetical protein [Spirochaetota bacterium]